MKPLLLTLCLVGALTGCSSVTEPSRARLVAAPDSAAAWWTADIACLDSNGYRPASPDAPYRPMTYWSGSWRRISWYEVPPSEPDGGTFACSAYANGCAGQHVAPHDIFLVAHPSPFFDAYVVRHEMLHDLLGVHGHPAIFWDCGLGGGLGPRP